MGSKVSLALIALFLFFMGLIVGHSCTQKDCPPQTAKNAAQWYDADTTVKAKMKP